LREAAGEAGPRTQGRKGSRVARQQPAFTLIELLVVIAVLATLAALLIPALAAAKDKGRKAACISNLRQVGIAVQLYAGDNDGWIPYGPRAPAFTTPGNFYPSTGSPTSLLSLQSGAPVGLGLLLKDYLAATPKVLFCPGTDQPADAAVAYTNLGLHQSQGSYYYRHGGNTQLFGEPAARPDHVRLDDLGTNRNGLLIRALAIDTLFVSPPSLAAFNVRTRTHHRQQYADVLFADGHVLSRPNRDGRFTVTINSNADLYDAFNRILQVLERADTEHDGSAL